MPFYRLDESYSRFLDLHLQISHGPEPKTVHLPGASSS